MISFSYHFSFFLDIIIYMIFSMFLKSILFKDYLDIFIKIHRAHKYSGIDT